MRFTSFALLLALATILPAAAETIHTLTRDDLVIRIVANSDRLRENYGPRFDRTAFVTSARLGGREYLHANGLCDEFGLLGLGVIGYNEAALGKTFVKMGVGLLVRDRDGPYAFNKPYPVAHFFPSKVTASATEVLVSQQAPGLYAYRKSYRLVPANTLEIAYTLTNEGSAPLPFETYNHNWLAFADVGNTTDYTIEPAFDLPGETPASHARDGRVLRLHTLPPGRGVNWAVDLSVPAADHLVTVRAPDGRSLVIGGDFTVDRFAFWGNATALSPELFLRAVLAPGESRTWTRTYRFTPPSSNRSKQR